MKTNDAPYRQKEGRLTRLVSDRLRVLLSVLFLTAPCVLQAQLSYVTNNGAITITSYSGGATAIIPGTIDGMPVTSIGDRAFLFRTKPVRISQHRVG